MFSKIAIAGLLAATGATAASSCSSATFTITASSDAAIASCTTLTGDVVISEDAGTVVDLGSVESIEGSLSADSLALISLSSSSLNSISDTFLLNNLTTLATLSFTALETVGSIQWQTLPALNSLTFTTGVNKASSVTISDTHLGSLEGLSLETVGTMDLNNNGRLTEIDLALTNLTGLTLQANGQDLAVTLDSLVWAANLTIANVTTFSVPALEVVNGSARFDSNYFTSFSAPNLTQTTSGDVSFINNADLTSLSLPVLEKVGGGLTIVNNTAFQNLTLPKLATVLGAVDCGGNFTNVEMPDIDDVVGTFTVTSTEDIDADCKVLSSHAPSPTGNGDIQGKTVCNSENANANSGSASGGSSSGSSNTSSNAANMHVSSAVVGLSFVGLLAQLL
ncbi:hypothetical protein M406DRAFT_108192 [Cryphonectria parasitica EP155]|uniref:Uncharacterized protein n=1 Tax=Cryphonectria parasitica (strain ATCC 38755 / EP155) TaxID=660469 RepID=A0A9P4XTP7_CRYP1|nr:uncharacterized protein M406DRAFT_108192 [Cryphonectria parasitica EP155]KAF3760661.1 hypothetical protein M406DRAFT_108192 [Cryphonectria parasitica EP155]